MVQLPVDIDVERDEDPALLIQLALASAGYFEANLRSSL